MPCTHNAALPSPYRMYEPNLVKTIQTMAPIREGRIQDKAFKNAPCLLYAALPEHVCEIGDAAFVDCAKLKLVDFSRIKRICAYGCMASGITSMTLNHIKRIEFCAFKDCTGLVGVNIYTKGSVHIGYNAFYNCRSLQTFIGGQETTFVVKDLAFVSCSALETFNGTVTAIGVQAFQRCSLNDRAPTFKPCVLLRQWAFSHTFICDLCIDVPCTLQADVFSNCKALRHVTLGDWHKKHTIIVHAYAFFYCPVLANVTLYEGVACAEMSFMRMPETRFVHPVAWKIVPKKHWLSTGPICLYNYTVVYPK